MYIPVICLQALMVFYVFFFPAWAMMIMWWIVLFNEVCILLAAILLFFLNQTSYTNSHIAPIMYVLLVLLNYFVNVTRGLVELYGAFTRKFSIFKFFKNNKG